MEDNFSLDQEWCGWFQDDSSTLHLVCTLFLIECHCLSDRKYWSMAQMWDPSSIGQGEESRIAKKMWCSESEEVVSRRQWSPYVLFLESQSDKDRELSPSDGYHPSGQETRLLFFFFVSPPVMSGLFATPWIIACQAPLSMGFSRQEYWNGLPFPSPGALSNPAIQLASAVFPTLIDRFLITAKHSGVNSHPLLQGLFLTQR